MPNPLWSGLLVPQTEIFSSVWVTIKVQFLPLCEMTRICLAVITAKPHEMFMCTISYGNPLSALVASQNCPVPFLDTNTVSGRFPIRSFLVYKHYWNSTSLIWKWLGVKYQFTYLIWKQQQQKLFFSKLFFKKKKKKKSCVIFRSHRSTDDK